MKPVFVDTSALIALGNQRDEFHQQAAQLLRDLVASQRRFVTTNAVILKLANAFSPAQTKPLAFRLIALIKSTPTWMTVIIDAALMERGLERFRKMQDKDWSLVDCISMNVASDMDISEIFSNDHHFEQAGFNILLKKT